MTATGTTPAPTPDATQELPGRQAAGERRPIPRPNRGKGTNAKATDKAKAGTTEQPKPKAEKPKLTPSQDRLNRGTSDAAIVKGLREQFGQRLVDASDAEIVTAIGWAETVKGAAKKIGHLLKDVEPTAA